MLRTPGKIIQDAKGSGILRSKMMEFITWDIFFFSWKFDIVICASYNENV